MSDKSKAAEYEQLTLDDFVEITDLKGDTLSRKAISEVVRTLRAVKIHAKSPETAEKERLGYCGHGEHERKALEEK